ncbi:hypothetical protein [Methylobacterium marchantiae]|uniref:Uncharacterized protein n=1 Tax=Methylobacterium marchantiae TaxID=600331 RepID=A0ABW3WU29_9HYPH
MVGIVIATLAGGHWRGGFADEGHGGEPRLERCQLGIGALQVECNFLETAHLGLSEGMIDDRKDFRLSVRGLPVPKHTFASELGHEPTIAGRPRCSRMLNVIARKQALQG